MKAYTLSKSQLLFQFSSVYHNTPKIMHIELNQFVHINFGIINHMLTFFSLFLFFFEQWGNSSPYSRVCMSKFQSYLMANKPH